MDSSSSRRDIFRADLQSKFNSLTNREEISQMLGIEDKSLRFFLYAPKNRKNLYRNFQITKKSGGIREISAPIDAWKPIQTRLLRILEGVYERRSGVHGFAREFDICTNAREHIGQKWVLNFDLKDFFPSITFPRVRGMFLHPPYNCKPEVATVLAQICCNDFILAQGSPTSPIISNMICAPLDSQLRKLARKTRCKYTRYADDITFSTNLSQFPTDLAEIEIMNSEISCKLGKSLLKVIKKNGFEINESKTRIRLRNQRQEVTGLVVNKKLNVQRKFIREIRALLFNWETQGLIKCQETYENKLGIHINKNKKFEYFVKGKINFLGQVRGKEDAIYLKFIKRFIQLAPHLVNIKTKAQIDWSERRLEFLLENSCIVDTINGDGSDCRQGTGFFLNDVGFITCAHVLFDDELQVIDIYKSDEVEKVRAAVFLKDDELDIAILKPVKQVVRSFDCSEKKLVVGDKIHLVGFPNYAPGHSGIVELGHVTGMRNDGYGNPRFLISSNIIFGNSGGPVFDEDFKVVGIAAKGSANQDESAQTEFNGVIPISDLTKLKIKT